MSAYMFLVSFGLIVSLVFASFAPPAKADEAPNPPSWASVSANSETKQEVVKWGPPSNLAESFEYKVQLLNNFGSVWEEKASSTAISEKVCVPIKDVKNSCIFSNVPAGFYSARVYAEAGGQESPPKESDVFPLSEKETNDGHIAFSPGDAKTFDDFYLLNDDEKDSLNWASSYKIALGSGGDFRPRDIVQRKEMASFLYRAFGKPEISEGDKPVKFLDSGKFGVHEGAIDWLSSKGILQGYTCTGKGVPNSICQAADDHYFLPDGETSRGNMAQFLYKLALTPEISSDEVTEYLDSLVDKDEIPLDQQKPIAWLIKESITTGYEDKTFRPKRRVSRIQMTQFLKRIAGKLGTTPYLREAKEIDSDFLDTGKSRSSITKISFINTLPKCDNRVDVSEDGFQNAIYACVDGDEIVVGAYGGVVANIYSSAYLFSKLGNSAGVSLDLEKLNASKTRVTDHMFEWSTLGLVELPKDFAAESQIMKSMFMTANLKTSIDWSDTDFVIKSDGKGGIIPDVNELFGNVVWNKHCVYVKNDTYRNLFINSITGATNEDILIPGESCKVE
jgi:hypothetical protein